MRAIYFVERTDRGIIEALKWWQHREKEHEMIFGPAALRDREFQREKLRYYQSVYRREKMLSPFRRSKMMGMLKLSIEGMVRQIYPTVLERLFHELGNLFSLPVMPIGKNNMIGLYPREVGPVPKLGDEKILSRQKPSDMNEQNFDYLKNQLKYTGFGEDLQRELREKMQEGKENFSLPHKAKFGNDDVEALLHFKKSEQSDMYFFNRYFLQLQMPKEEDSLAQSFRIGRENNITLKEGYNMLKGRAVHKDMTNKEGQKYQAWLQLDFKETDQFGDFKMKQFHQNYGFDLKDALAKYPIKEMGNEQTTKDLMQSLERGNRQQVTFTTGGKEQKVFVEAAPQFKSLNFYDEGAKRVQAQALLQPAAEKQDTSKEKKQDQKKGVNGEGDEGAQKNSKNKRRGHKIS